MPLNTVPAIHGLPEAYRDRGTNWRHAKISMQVFFGVRDFEVKMMKSIVITVLWAMAQCSGQTRLDLGRQGKAPDFSAMTHTRPIQVGIALPASCNVGELFYLSSAQNGQNLHGCAATGAWQVISGLSQCTVTGETLTCPGELYIGTGATSGGEIQLSEKAASGVDFVSWLAPDAISTSYRLQLPGNPPQDQQVLLFAPPVNGLANGTWATRFAKAMESRYYPAAQANAADSWVTGPHWSASGGGSGATAAGGGSPPFQVGYLSFAGGSKRHAVVHLKLPAGWDGQAVAAKLFWATDNGDSQATVKWQMTAVCVEEGQSLLNPVFPAPLDAMVTVPFPADTTLKRITTVFSPLPLTGCTSDSILYLLLDRDGTADSNTGPALVFGIQLDMKQELQP